jgi:peptidoglycan/xylan/chitin deacetylase (PgdA/CDA1 family)
MLVTVPKWIKYFYPSLIWEWNEDAVYLTFDDGPHPVITPQVLDILDKFNAKATFFCVGDNVRKYPDVFNEIKNRGHKTGNHSFNHINGWKTKDKIYFYNVQKAGKLINSNLFRPPYGKIKFSQIKVLRNNYKIIMWSVLTYDFSKKIDKMECFNNSLKGLKNGNITVFHDSAKAEKNMMFALPRFLEKGLENKFRFKAMF